MNELRKIVHVVFILLLFVLAAMLFVYAIHLLGPFIIILLIWAAALKYNSDNRSNTISRQPFTPKEYNDTAERIEIHHRNDRAIAKAAYYETDMIIVPEYLREEYRVYLRSPEWKALRKLILKRDSHQCVHCSYVGYLEVHHTSYEGIFEMLFNEEQLESVCHECHVDIHIRLKEL